MVNLSLRLVPLLILCYIVNQAYENLDLTQMKLKKNDS